MKPGKPKRPSKRAPRLYYGCKCIFVHPEKGFSKRNLYEESVIVIQAPNAKIAREKAIRVARGYERKAIRFCDIVATYPILENTLANSVEVFSGFRLSALSPKDFVSRFYLSKSCFASGLPG